MKEAQGKNAKGARGRKAMCGGCIREIDRREETVRDVYVVLQYKQ